MAIADVSAALGSIDHWIGGKAVQSDSGRSGIVWNPSTGQAKATLPLRMTGKRILRSQCPGRHLKAGVGPRFRGEPK